MSSRAARHAPRDGFVAETLARESRRVFGRVHRDARDDSNHPRARTRGEGTDDARGVRGVRGARDAREIARAAAAAARALRESPAHASARIGVHR